MRLILKSDNQSISANLIRPENLKSKNPALIFIHGWKSNQEGNIKRATEISKHGFICMTLDLRGHGQSDGSIEQFSRKDHLEDIKSAYNYLVSLPEVDKKQIGTIGSSYGGYLAAVAANYLKFKWLVLRVPALYFDQKFNIPTEKLIGEDETGKAFKLSGLTPENSLALKAVTSFPGEILIIESEKDKVIPHSVIKNYLRFVKDKVKLTYEIMENTPHALETKEQEKKYLQVLKKWLETFN